MKPALPKDEARRLAALRSLRLQDGPEERFDRITRLAQRIFSTAAATLSLVEEQEIRFKSRQGVEFPAPSRAQSFCGHAILSEQTFVVPDARADKRFADNPLVVEFPKFIFYAGQPLRAADGSLLGTLGLWDLRPRQLSETERLILWDLGAWAEEELASRRLVMTQAELQATRDDLRQFLDTSVDMVQVVDPAGRFLFRNQKWHETLGYAPDDAQAAGIFDVVAPAQRGPWQGILAGIMAGGPPVSVTVPFLAKDGSIVEASGKIAGQRQEGKVVAARAVLREMTRSRLAEKRLTQLVRIARGLETAAAAEPVPAALLVLREICESCGWEAGCLWTPAPDADALSLAVFYRKAALGAGGFETALRDRGPGSASGFIGRTWSARKPVWCKDLARESGFSAAVEAQREGLRAAVALPVASGGQAYGVLAFFSGAILEPEPALWETLHAAALQLGWALRLHRAWALVQEFAARRRDFLARLADDLSGPLRSVSGLLEKIRNSGLPDEACRLTAAAYDAVQLPLAKLARAAEHARLGAAAPALEPKDFCLDELVETVLRRARGAQAAGPELLAFWPDDLPVSVHGEPRLLGQALQSLADNAVKFGGTGDVSVRVLWKPEPDDRMLVRFEVRDAGPGLAAQYQDQAWAGLGVSRGQGLGLGLPLAKRCVELMGGRIGLESGAGGPGACFWFEAALKRRPGAAAPPSLAAAAQTSVLVVDDNAGSRELMLDMLRGWGFRAEAAGNGDEALALMKAIRPGLVMVDQSLPPPGGLACMRRLLDAPAAAAGLRVILLSSPGQPPDLQALAAAGADLYLEKPVVRPVLRRALAFLLEAPEPPRVPRALAAPRPLKVLLVQADEMQRRRSLLILRRLGYAADQAADGREALARFDRGGCGLILLARRLPGLDGIRVVGEIRRSEGPLRHTPVVGLAAYGEAQARKECLAASMDDCIAEPLRQDELSRVCEAWDSPLDIGALSHFMDVAGRDQPGMIAAAMDQFLAEMAAGLATMKEALAHGDTAALRAAAGAVPPVARKIGARGLVDISVALAQADVKSAGQFLAAWENELAQVKAALERKRTRRP